MQIYTSSWFTYFGPGRVGISQGVPRNMRAGYRLYKKLAPSWSLVRAGLPRSQYEPFYREDVLDRLDPGQVLDDLRRLSPEHPPVLLCYERPPFDEANFCHRHMVAEWLAAHIGQPVLEWSGPAESNRDSETGRLL